MNDTTVIKSFKKSWEKGWVKIVLYDHILEFTIARLNDNIYMLVLATSTNRRFQGAATYVFKQISKKNWDICLIKQVNEEIDPLAKIYYDSKAEAKKAYIKMKFELGSPANVVDYMQLGKR